MALWPTPGHDYANLAMTAPALLSVAEAQARLLALASPVGTHTVPLAASVGHWAAANIEALHNRPAHPLSAMDGYALRRADLPGPWRIIGTSAAGHPFAGAIDAGEAARIFTGAVLPRGADTVLLQEDALRDGDTLRIADGVATVAGAHVRQLGADFCAGDVVIAKGTKMSTAHIALAATAGHATLPVHRPIRIAILASGDELRAPGAPLADGQVPESNSVMLAAMLASQPVAMTDLGIIPDRLDALCAAFASCRADIIVTTGGASVGDHDLIRPALKASGGAVDFWRIALRPGKPMLAGTLGDAVVLGLPGNPVSAFVTAWVFLRPLIAAFGGATDCLPRNQRAVLAAPLPANDARQEYVRARWHDGAVLPAGSQDSAMLATLAAAQCLVVRPPHAPAAQPGDLVDILPIA